VSVCLPDDDPDVDIDIEQGLGLLLDVGSGVKSLD
jgi:hypothetical protein